MGGWSQEPAIPNSEFFDDNRVIAGGVGWVLGETLSTRRPSSIRLRLQRDFIRFVQHFWCKFRLASIVLSHTNWSGANPLLKT
jgi:hypothetical protein